MAVNFDGTNDKINCGSDASLDDLDASTMSISCWLYIDTNDATLRRIVSKQSTASGGLTGWSLYLQNDVGNPDAIVFSVAYDNTDGAWVCEDDISTGSWVHIALTYDGGNVANDPIFYLNGSTLTIDNEVNPVGNRDSSAAYNFYIGNFDNLERPFHGKESDVAIWNTILTPAEIALLASSRLKRMPLQIQPANLKAYYPLDDHPHNDTANSANGLVFKDLSGNGNDGTASGCNAQAENFLTYPYEENVIRPSAKGLLGQGESYLSYQPDVQVLNPLIVAAAGGLSKALSQAVSLTETPVKFVFKALSQSLTVTEDDIKEAGKVQSDSISVTENEVKRPTKVVSDSITVTEDEIKNFFKVLADSASVTDTLSLFAYKVISQNITVTENNNFGSILRKALSLGISVNETLAKIFYKSLSESSTVTDTIVKNVFKRISDSITVTETFSSPSLPTTTNFIRERYITANRGMKSYEIEAMKHWISGLTVADIKQMEQDFREMLKDFE